MTISSILALAAPERAVVLSYIFYLLNVLVPIVPAVIIYWLFPEGKTGIAAASKKRRATGRREKGRARGAPAASIEGDIGGWKIKAVGAWGAYVTAFLLGFWAIEKNAIPLINKAGGASVWDIESDFKFTDEKDAEIANATVDKLQVEPPEVKPWGKHATIKVFSDSMDPPPQLKIYMEGYDFKIVDLPKDVPRNGNKITLSGITLKRLPPPKVGPAPTALPTGEGPPALTASK
jgi:hypothetical protein